jgi:hypothetical protein
MTLVVLGRKRECGLPGIGSDLGENAGETLGMVTGLILEI